MLEAVQELCRSFYGLTAVTAESYGCVWHLQQRYAGHATCWRCHWSEMEWTYGAITFLNGRYSKIGARCPMRNAHGYTTILLGRRASRRHPDAHKAMPMAKSRTVSTASAL